MVSGWPRRSGSSGDEHIGQLISPGPGQLNQAAGRASAGARRDSEPRLMPLDALRGLIMILMALDHANYFVAQKYSPGEHWGGSFPVYSDALTFLARWLTHPAAPGFMFLMGVGMTLLAHARRQRGWSESQILRHVWIRGALLIVLELSIVNRAWHLGPYPFPSVYIGVLLALGGGMILGSLFIRFKAWQLAAVAGLLFIGTEWFHPHPDAWGTNFDQRLGLLFSYSGGDMDFWSNFPILPWLELVLLGMAFGNWLLKDAQQALRACLVLGVVFLLGFVFLRSRDGFGNIRPRPGDTWIDFLNVVKYPPAMTFTLVTMGINLVLLWLFSRAAEGGNRWPRPLAIFGRAPLFFYILHLYLYMLLGRLFAPSGTTIVEMLPYWLLGLLILLPLTRWYGAFKRRQPPNSVLRFL